jgi:hypothetical protein
MAQAIPFDRRAPVQCKQPLKALPPNLVNDIAASAAFVRQHAIASIYHAGSGHPGARCPARTFWHASSARN